jgi:hypothetical protein
MALLLEQDLRLRLPPEAPYSWSNKESILTKLFAVAFQLLPNLAETPMW